MKKTTLYIGTGLAVACLLSAGILLANNNFGLNIAVRASYVTYKHYRAIAPSGSSHCCKEFWVSCSDYSY